MGKAKTYVLYVGGRQEPRAQRLIERLVSPDLYDEVYSPRYIKAIKHAGVWHRDEALLVPGYLFVRTAHIEELQSAFYTVPALTKFLRLGEIVEPLGEGEMAWIDCLTKPNDRTVDFSEGFIVGDRVVVTSGPLQGYEREIVKIDRRKRLAYLTFHILGRVKDIKVGLEIVRKVPEAAGVAVAQADPDTMRPAESKGLC